LQLYVEDHEKRIVIGLPAAFNRTSSAYSTSHNQAWLVGMFLYIELVQQRKSFSLETDLFAQRVREGVIGRTHWF
jgi:hypothetical protein